MKPRYGSVEALLADCQSLDECIRATFDSVWETADGALHAKCCGAEVRYTSGILGTDGAQCETCGSRMVNVLSPHVSPVLVTRDAAPEGNSTRMPSEEFVQRMDGRVWLGARLKDAAFKESMTP